MWLLVVCCWSVEKVTSTFLTNQPGFGANLMLAPYSKVYQDASFEPVAVTIASILMKFLLLWLVVVWCWSVEKVTSTFLKNQPGFGANLASAPYSKVYQDASFEPVSVTIGSILMKFLLMWLLVVCCWSVEKVTSTFLTNQPGFGANLMLAPYSKVYQDASFEPVAVTIASILMKFLLLWLVVVWCWSVEKVTSTFLKNQPGFGANLASAPYRGLCRCLHQR